jgi:hypothetical protein
MAKKRTTENELVASTGAATAPARRRTDAASHKARTRANSAGEALAGSAVSTPAPEPTHDQIAALAYSYWVARDYQEGSAEEDWLRAEGELQPAVEAA